jgi:heat shock protein HslJ
MRDTEAVVASGWEKLVSFAWTLVGALLALMVVGCGGAQGEVTPTDADSVPVDAPPGVRVTVTYLNESGEPTDNHQEPIVTGPMDITFQPYPHELGIETGGPGSGSLEGLPEDAQTVETCADDPSCGLVRLDLQKIPAGEYEIPTEGVLDTASVRVVFDRTEPTTDVDVQGEWTLRTLESDGEPLAAPSDGTYTLHVEGIAMSGVIDCNDYGGVLTVDGNDVNSRYGSNTDMGCRDDDAQPEASAFDSAFAQGLDDAEHIERDGDTLRLSSPEKTLIFDRA